MNLCEVLKTKKPFKRKSDKDSPWWVDVREIGVMNVAVVDGKDNGSYQRLNVDDLKTDDWEIKEDEDK